MATLKEWHMELRSMAATAATAAMVVATAATAVGLGQRPGEAASYACRRCGTVLYREDEIVETRPMSRRKRWALKRVVRQAAQV